MTLTFVEPEVRSTTLNILLFGPPKSGKSVAACSAPGPVMVINAEGPEALMYARRHHRDKTILEVVFEGKQTLDDAYLYLQGPNKAGVRTLVLDSVGEIHSKLLEELGGFRPTQQNYGDVNAIIRRFVRAIRDLDVNVVLVCHEQIDDSDGDRIVRPKTGGRQLPEELMAMVSVVAYCGVAVTEEDGEKRQRYVAQLVSAGGRRAGDRTGVLGDFRDLDLEEWLDAVGVAYSNKTAPMGQKEQQADEAEDRGRGGVEQQGATA